MQLFSDFWETIRKPHVKKVFFPSIPTNRKLLLWYAGKLVSKSSRIEGEDQLRKINGMRQEGQPFTFICNHLTYADSHVVETLMIRSGASDLADKLIHIAGQKTFEIYRYFMTRSLNTVRVYQPKAKVSQSFRRRMNMRALKWAAHQKRRGFALIVFPEGTRTRQHSRFNLNAANPKTTLYFRDSNVVPLGIMGAEKILPLGSVLPRRAVVTLKVGEPIQHSKLEEEFRQRTPGIPERELRQQLMHYYMKQVNSLLTDEYRSPE